MRACIKGGQQRIDEEKCPEGRLETCIGATYHREKCTRGGYMRAARRAKT